MSGTKVLIVDDEEDILELLRYNLESEGFNVVTAIDGKDAIKTTKEFFPELIILDLMIPKIDGLEVCKRLKQDENTANIPIIMLTAKTSETDIVIGLEFGADDYMRKPFSTRELLSRVKAILRRSKKKDDDSKHIIQRAGFRINSAKRTVFYNDKEIDLTFSEFEILKHLISHPGWVFSRAQIMNAVKGDDYIITERAIDVQILNIRKKLKKAGNYIKTVRAVGYKFND